MHAYVLTFLLTYIKLCIYGTNKIYTRFSFFVTHKNVGSENLTKFMTSFSTLVIVPISQIKKHYTTLFFYRQQALDVVIINRSPTVDKKFFFPSLLLIRFCRLLVWKYRKIQSRIKSSEAIMWVGEMTGLNYSYFCCEGKYIESKRVKKDNYKFKSHRSLHSCICGSLIILRNGMKLSRACGSSCLKF